MRKLINNVQSWEAVLHTISGGFMRIELIRYRGGPRPTLFPGNTAWSPEVDLFESHDELIMEVNLAGVKSDQVKVQFSSRFVQISGTRLDTHECSQRHYYVMEIERGNFSRTIELPAAVDEESMHADINEGILKLRMRRKLGGQFTGSNIGRPEDFK